MAAVYYMEVSRVLAETPGTKELIESAGLKILAETDDSHISLDGPVCLWKVFDAGADPELTDEIVNPLFEQTRVDAGKVQVRIIDRKVITNG